MGGLDFSLVPGQVTVLLGRNGAGKSTLLRLCLGVLKPDAGRVEVCGNDPVRHPRDVRRIVGYVPDKPDVYDWMTARELLRFLKPQYPTWNGDRAARVAEQLSVPLDTPFKGLSRGEGMKAMLMAAPAPDPALLLLDEPFAGLGPVVREGRIPERFGFHPLDDIQVLTPMHRGIVGASSLNAALQKELNASSDELPRRPDIQDRRQGDADQEQL